MSDGHFMFNFAAGDAGQQAYLKGGDGIENASAERFQRARAIAGNGWWDQGGQAYLAANQRSHNQNLTTAEQHRGVSGGWGNAGVDCQSALNRARSAIEQGM
jgi:hypothetical protein